MYNAPNSESQAPRRYRVAVIEWISYKAEVTETSEAETAYKAHRLWMEGNDNNLFN